MSNQSSQPTNVGSNDQLGAVPEALYCYSTNEEEYYGAFDTREEALADADAAFKDWVRDIPLHERTPWNVWHAAVDWVRRNG